MPEMIMTLGSDYPADARRRSGAAARPLKWAALRTHTVAGTPLRASRVPDKCRPRRQQFVLHQSLLNGDPEAHRVT